MNQHLKNLQLLSIFHYVVGAFTMLFSLFPLIHVGIGLMFVLAPEQMMNKGQPLPPFMGWLFIIMGTAFILVGMSLGLCVILAGRSLARRKNYWFVFVTACIQSVMCMPLGTVLGIFTIVCLSQEGMKPLFGLPETSQKTTPPESPTPAAS